MARKISDNDKKIAALSYLAAPLIYFNKRYKKNSYIHFHACEAMNLFIFEIVSVIASIILLDVKVKRKCSSYLYGVEIYCGEEIPIVIIALIIMLFITIMIFIISGIVNSLNGNKAKLEAIGKLNLFK